ncbi:MAG TPA: TadE/TadG family type IV pilus assembly protein [Candidatus Udaeobacter sp.]|nr:TadE/TadG family type IV pilus assembly protein [Candidatus Udaeobacter sp.]
MRSDQRGSSLVEFALILPFLLVITFAVVDLSHALVVRSVVTSAAREGARRAIELSVPTGNGASPTADYTEVYSRVTDVLTPAGVSFKSLDVSGPDADHNLTVTVSADFTWMYFGLLNFFGGGGFSNPQTLTAIAVMRKIG